MVIVGLHRPKDRLNVGMVMRALGCYDAQKLLIGGELRFPWERMEKIPTDPAKSGRRIPLIHCEGGILESPEFGYAVPVAVEIAEGATPLPFFQHPDRALYLFGPEDGSLPVEIIDRCEHKVVIPYPHKGLSMNLAQAVNVVLYDRMAKRLGFPPHFLPALDKEA